MRSLREIYEKFKRDRGQLGLFEGSGDTKGQRARVQVTEPREI